MKLYELSTEMQKWIEKYNEVETDEQLQTVEAQLNDLQLAFDQKAVGVAKYVLNTDADAEAIDTEIKRLGALKKRAETQSERMRLYLKKNMLATNTTEIDGTILKIKLKKNPPRVDVEDENAVPDEYKRSKVVVSIDKDAIKTAVKAGVGVNGTKVIQDSRVEIK